MHVTSWVNSFWKSNREPFLYWTRTGQYNMSSFRWVGTHWEFENVVSKQTGIPWYLTEEVPFESLPEDARTQVITYILTRDG